MLRLKELRCIAAVPVMILMFPLSLNAQPRLIPAMIVTPIASYDQPGSVFQVFDATGSDKPSELYIGVEGGTFGKGKQGFGIVTMSLNDKPAASLRYWRDLAEPKLEPGLPVARMNAMLRTKSGDLLCFGHVDGAALSAITIGVDGKQRAEQMLFDGSADEEVTSSLITDRGDILIVGDGPNGAGATLLSGNMKVIWTYKYEGTQNWVLESTFYYPRSKEFVVCGTLGSFNKFGQAKDGSKVLMLRLDYEGKLLTRSISDGRLLAYVGGSKEVQYIIVNQEGKLSLKTLDSKFKVVKERQIQEFAPDDESLSRPFAIAPRQDGHLIVGGIRDMTLHLCEYDANLEPVAATSMPRSGVGENGLQLVQCNEDLYVVSTEMKEPEKGPATRGSQISLTQKIVVERVGK